MHSVWPAVAAIGTVMAGAAAVATLFFPSKEKVVVVQAPTSQVDINTSPESARPADKPTTSSEGASDSNANGASASSEPVPVRSDTTPPPEASPKDAEPLVVVQSAPPAQVKEVVASTPVREPERSTALSPEPVDAAVQVAPVPGPDGCVRVGPRLAAAILVGPGTRICAADSENEAVIKKVTEKGISYSVNGGFEINCNTTELCGFDWRPRGPVFNVRVKTGPDGAWAGSLSAPRQ